MFHNFSKKKHYCIQEKNTSNFDVENQTFTLEDFQKVLEFWSDKVRGKHLRHLA